MMRRVVLTVFALLASVSAARAADRPNILWLVTEDIGPQLACYGDSYSVTPNLDKFASQSVMFLNAWSNAPVCAAARTTLIVGLYAPATGGEHMRSRVDMAPFMKMYPSVLRDAGYYCTNNAKEDYNLNKNGLPWDESSAKAHYKNRKPGQPFMAVFNQECTHESKIRTRPHKWVHDISKAPIPAYHPDVKEAREDWAQYYDNITDMDVWFGKMLKELADAGLADDTIVFFYGDHGSGMPRSKRWPYNSGLRVPLLVHFPEKFKNLAPKDCGPGTKTDRLVSFVDLAPTLYSLAGAKKPDYVQGKAFAGAAEEKPRDYLFGYRGRMDERYDCVRTVRDKQYIYIRNFMPHRVYGQYLNYMFQTPTTRVWKQMFDEGKLNADQSHFWQTKPPEELYDLSSDKWEVHNLAGLPEHDATLKKMRGVLHDWILETRDIGLLPEGEIHTRAKGSTPYEYAQSKAYPMAEILDTAEKASSGDPAATDALVKRLKDDDSGVRYWAATGLLIRGAEACSKNHDALMTAMQKDASPYVQSVAAEALARFGSDADLSAALDTLVKQADLNTNEVYVVLSALNRIDLLGQKAMPLKDKLAVLPRAKEGTVPVMGEYCPRLFEHLGEQLGYEEPKDQAKTPKAEKKANRAKKKAAK